MTTERKTGQRPGLQFAAICRVLRSLEQLRYYGEPLSVALTPDFVLDRYSFADGKSPDTLGERVAATREFPEIGGHAAIGSCALARLRPQDDACFDLILCCRTNQIGRGHLAELFDEKLRLLKCEPVDLSHVETNGDLREAHIPLGNGTRQVNPSTQETKLCWRDLPRTTRDAVLNSDVVGLLSVKDPSFEEIYADMEQRDDEGVLIIDMTSSDDDPEQNARIWKNLKQTVSSRVTRECYVSFSESEVNVYHALEFPGGNPDGAKSTLSMAKALSQALSHCVLFFHDVGVHYLISNGSIVAAFSGFVIGHYEQQLERLGIGFANGLGDTLNAGFALAVGAYHRAKVNAYVQDDILPSLTDCLVFAAALIEARLKKTWQRVALLHERKVSSLDLISYYPSAVELLDFVESAEVHPALPEGNAVDEHVGITPLDRELCELFVADSDSDVIMRAVNRRELRPAALTILRRRRRQSRSRYVFFDLDYTLFDSRQRYPAAEYSVRENARNIATLGFDPDTLVQTWRAVYERHVEFRGHHGIADFRQVWSSAECWSLVLAASMDPHRGNLSAVSNEHDAHAIVSTARGIQKSHAALCAALDTAFWSYRFTPYALIREALESLNALELEVYLVAEGDANAQDTKLKKLGLDRLVPRERRLFACALPRPTNGGTTHADFFDDRIEPLQRDEDFAEQGFSELLDSKLNELRKGLAGNEILPPHMIDDIQRTVEPYKKDLHTIKGVSEIYRELRFNLRHRFHAKALLSVLLEGYNPRKLFEEELESLGDDELVERFNRVLKSDRAKVTVVGDRVDSELLPYIEMDCNCRLVRLELSDRYTKQEMPADVMAVKSVHELVDLLASSEYWREQVSYLSPPTIHGGLELTPDRGAILEAATKEEFALKYPSAAKAAREVIARRKVVVD